MHVAIFQPVAHGPDLPASGGHFVAKAYEFESRTRGPFFAKEDGKFETLASRESGGVKIETV